MVGVYLIMVYSGIMAFHIHIWRNHSTCSSQFSLVFTSMLMDEHSRTRLTINLWVLLFTPYQEIFPFILLCLQPVHKARWFSNILVKYVHPYVKYVFEQSNQLDWSNQSIHKSYLLIWSKQWLNHSSSFFFFSSKGLYWECAMYRLSKFFSSSSHS